MSTIDKGIITYIYLENFVTYSKVCVKPGRYLNLIIGPNGTGKSTIVCAIVLGLGGKPSTIGRATHVAEYIKSGCEEAKIEIHLTNGKRDDIVICRAFNRKGKSFWFLNDTPSNMKEVQEVTKRFNIQVDNLCQFLPQDKVQDFSKMNAQELLENTQRSVSDPIMLEHHTNLIQYRRDHKDLEKTIEAKKKLLHVKTQKYDGLKESVSSIKERKLIKKRIINLNQKKAWLLYDQKRKEMTKLKKYKDSAVAKAGALEAQIKPVSDAIEKIKSEIHLLQSRVADQKHKVNIKTTRLKRMMDEILECDNNVKDRENLCKQTIQTEEARDNEIDMAQQQRDRLEYDLSQMLNDESEQSLMKKREEILSNVEQKRGDINKLASKAGGLKQEEDRISIEIRAQESELQLLNIETKRLQLLREKSMDTYRAVLWLRENRNMFAGTIHEPILLNLNVKDVSYAKYLENTIAFRDLIAFVCEDKRDMNKLLSCLRDQQNLQVNAVHSDPLKQVSMTPIVPLEHIKRYGFTHYLVSLVEAPSTIMKYLVSMYGLNRIPIGTSQVDDNTDHIPSSIRSYFSQSNLYSVNKSKYTGEKSIAMSSISSSGMLSIVFDRSRVLKIEEKLIALREKKSDVLNTFKRMDEEIHQRNKELDEIKTTRNRYQQSIQQIQTLKSRISMVKKKITDLQDGRTSIENIKKSSTKDIKVILEKQLKLYKTYNAELEECFKYTTISEKTELELKLQNRQLRTKINDSQDLRDKLKAAENEVRQFELELRPMGEETKRMYEEARETTNGLSPTDPAFIPINRIFSKLPLTLGEINNELNIAQAKVFCMGNNIDGENILREFEQVEKDIHDLKEFIETKSRELGTTSENIDTLREEWLKPLCETVEKINSNFSTYFSAMGCAGEVILAQPENKMDFDQYGLKIRVKFRDNDQLQELTRHHQSGGERALTTAIYMISLQELTNVPFRCVDEINQGMDALNERRVFNLLVKMTGRRNSSQYFLLTPKLLSDLHYSETVTVHCVFNGPFMINHTDFDTNEYCKYLLKTIEKED